MAELETSERTASRQLVRFLVVGLSNTLISFVAYRLLLAGGVAYAPAALLAFVPGAVNGYVLNRRWTFAARDTRRARVLYVMTQAAAAVSLSLLVVLLVHAGFSRVGAYVLAVPPVTLAAFTANRLWTFRVPGT